MGQKILLRALMGWKRDNITQKCTLCYNITQYHRRLTEGYNSPSLQDRIQLFQSADIEHGQDVLIDWNHHFVPGAKEPFTWNFTIHLGFGFADVSRRRGAGIPGEGQKSGASKVVYKSVFWEGMI